MAFLVKQELVNLNIAYRGQPFAQFQSKWLSTNSLNIAWNGGPFVVTDNISSYVYVNVSGTWKEAIAVYVNVSGSWKQVTDVRPYVSGSWKQ